MPEHTAGGHAITVRVYHDYYGCETGCCGHTIELTLPDGSERTHFEFDHPGKENRRAWARELVEDYLRRYRPECLATIDWESLDLQEVDKGCQWG